MALSCDDLRANKVCERELCSLRSLCSQGISSEEKLIHQLHQEGKPIATIARMVGLSRKSVYKAFNRKDDAA